MPSGKKPWNRSVTQGKCDAVLCFAVLCDFGFSRVLCGQCFAVIGFVLKPDHSD